MSFRFKCSSILSVCVLLWGATLPLLAEHIPARYRDALRLLSTGDSETAITALQDVIRTSPQFAPAYGQLIEAYWERQPADLEPPRRFLEEQLAVDPTRPYALLGMLLLKERFVGAIESRDQFLIRCLRALPHWTGCFHEATRIERVSAAAESEIRKSSTKRPPPAAAQIAAAGRHRFGGRYREAEILLRRVLRSSAIDVTTRINAQLLLCLVLRQSPAGLPESIVLGNESLRLARQAEDPDLIWESLSHLIEVHYRAGNLDAMIAYAQQTRDHVSDLFPIRYRVQAARWLANAWIESGKTAEAITVLVECTKWRIFPEELYSLLLTDIGEAEMILGRTADAGTHFDAALRMATLARAPWHSAWALRCKAQLAVATGQFGKAITFYEEALDRFRRAKATSTWLSLLSLAGRAYVQVGDYERAESMVLQSLAAARVRRELPELQRIQNTLADLYYQTGKLALAIGLWRETVHSAQGFVGPSSYPLHAHISLSNAFREIGQMQQSLLHAESAQALLAKNPNALAAPTVYLALGNAQRSAGQRQKAEDSVRRALRTAIETANLELTWQARVALARFLPAEGAIQELRRATEEIEQMRSMLPTPDLRVSYLASRIEPYETLVELLALNGQSEQALEYAERGRARATTEVLSGTLGLFSRELSRLEVDEHAQLVRNVSRAGAAAMQNPSDHRKSRLREAEGALSRWIEKARAEDPDSIELRYPLPLKASDMQETARQAGQTIILYSLGRSASFAWVITADRISMKLLPSRDSIHQRVWKVRECWRQRPEGSGSAALPEVSWLNHHLLASLGLGEAKRLTIVADGALHYLPVEALDQSLLGGGFAIAYAPSISALRQLLRKVPASGAMEMLAMGAPTLSSQHAVADYKVVRSAYAQRGIHFADLPHARRELQQITSLYPTSQTSMHTGVDATEEAFKNERLSQYRYIHLATHAFFDETMPVHASLLLRPSSADDGFLQVPEILALRVDSDLVVLSACQTGLGKLERGEGIRGLTRAFLYAGARRVLVSLWEVNDIATADLMQRFYVHLRKGELPADALWQAKREMMTSPIAAYRHPHFWAGFVLVGVR